MMSAPDRVRVPWPLAIFSSAFVGAVASSAAAFASPGGSFLTGPVGQLLPLVFIVVIFYFLLIRPQQQRMKNHREMIAAVRRGDIAVTAGGLIGKVIRVSEDEVTIELGDSEEKVRVRAVKSTLQDIRSKTEPVAANDTEN